MLLQHLLLHVVLHLHCELSHSQIIVIMLLLKLVQIITTTAFIFTIGHVDNSIGTYGIYKWTSWCTHSHCTD